MQKPLVSIVRYEKPLESIREAVDLAGGFGNLSAKHKVFIKPNIVFWTRAVEFPKWGVITTTRVLHDIIVLLKEIGVDDITIGEGSVVFDPKDRETQRHAYESLGYFELEKRYGVKLINVFERKFKEVDLGDGVALKFNADFLDSDFLINLPVMKTHAQTVVSLGIKCLKGLIDINSRKKCHSPDEQRDLHFKVSKLADAAPPSFTLIDGIYTNERGPGFDGTVRRSNLLVASQDVFSADKVAARILGYETAEVPHLSHFAQAKGRTRDLSDLEIAGPNLDELNLGLKYSFPYTPDDSLPLPMAKMGIKGVSYRKYDLTMCTYCSLLTGAILTSIAFAWKGVPWDDVEILTGKMMKPTPGRRHTILIGKCIYQLNKNDPSITNMHAVKTCPPAPTEIVKALHEAGIMVDPGLILELEKSPGILMKKYKDNPDFSETFFRLE
jgi:uncharacterized protein (DUF362 family)